MTEVWGFRNAEDANLARKLNLASVILSAILVIALPLSLAMMAKRPSVTMMGEESSAKGVRTFGLILFLVAILHVAAILAMSSYIRFKLLEKINVSA